MKHIAGWINDVISNHQDEKKLMDVNAAVKELCNKFPVPGVKV